MPTEEFGELIFVIQAHGGADGGGEDAYWLVYL